MPATKVEITNFRGAGRVFERTPLGLAPLLRGLATDDVRLAMTTASLSALTDNTGGAFTDGPPPAAIALMAARSPRTGAQALRSRARPKSGARVMVTSPYL